MTTNGTNERLAELGLELPEPAAPGGNYVPFVRTRDLVFVTGQLSQWNGEFHGQSQVVNGASDVFVEVFSREFSRFAD